MKYLRKFDSVSDMETAIANSTIGILGLAYNNGQPVMKNKDGGSPVPPAPDPTVPFYIEDISGSENTVQIVKYIRSESDAPTLTIEKSLDGEIWETMGSTSATPITATIPANGKLYLRCNAPNWGTSAQKGHNIISITNNCNVGGNIMSLLYSNDFADKTRFTRTYVFKNLFRNNSTIVNANNLLLPATTLIDSCYANMFVNCTSLITTPALPATTLANSCYDTMFCNCSSLTTAPVLPGTISSSCTRCYAYMFNGCTNLNYIKCLTTNISANSCTMSWVTNVAATGTFVKDPNMSTSTWGTGANGIPEGWTVQDAQD